MKTKLLYAIMILLSLGLVFAFAIHVLKQTKESERTLKVWFIIWCSGLTFCFIVGND